MDDLQRIRRAFPQVFHRFLHRIKHRGLVTYGETTRYTDVLYYYYRR
jgi:hypothetical protein